MRSSSAVAVLVLTAAVFMSVVNARRPLQTLLYKPIYIGNQLFLIAQNITQHKQEKYCEFLKKKHPNEPHTKFCSDDAATSTKIHRPHGSSPVGPQSMKDFLSNIIRPVTGHIYNGVSRFYPEYKNKPQKSCERCARCNRNQDRRFYDCNHKAFNKWRCLGKMNRYTDRYCHKNEFKTCYLGLSSYCKRQCNVCSRNGGEYYYHDGVRNDQDVEIWDA